jgi:NAD(P)-dependent dehydrogenase (short-subunit alcohol dehydrogenase family)
MGRHGGMSKAALVHLTRILDVELRPHGIRVVTPRITTIR